MYLLSSSDGCFTLRGSHGKNWGLLPKANEEPQPVMTAPSRGALSPNHPAKLLLIPERHKLYEIFKKLTVNLDHKVLAYLLCSKK